MSTVGNGTTGASGTGPASGYNLELSHLLVVFFLFLYRLSANTSNPYNAIMLLIFTYSMIYFMIFRIKICHKILKSLTFTS
jgi:Ca2+/Na+ antiporter